MRILVVTDGSPQADLGVQLGAHVGPKSEREIILLTVIRGEYQRDQAAAILARAELIVRTSIKTVLKCVRTGQPADQILRVAKEGNVQLIILGDHPRQGLSVRLMGPTMERVIAKKICPVLIGRGKAQPLLRVLLCESGREPSLLNRLIELMPHLLNTMEELTVLHVMSQIAASPGVQDWELDASADELIEKHSPEGRLLEQDIELLKQFNLQLNVRVVHGLVVESILAEAKSGGYDLVMIGAHQSQGWEHFLLDDLAHEIICKVDRPVLVV